MFKKLNTYGIFVALTTFVVSASAAHAQLADLYAAPQTAQIQSKRTHARASRRPAPRPSVTDFNGVFVGPITHVSNTCGSNFNPVNTRVVIRQVGTQINVQTPSTLSLAGRVNQRSLSAVGSTFDPKTQVSSVHSLNIAASSVSGNRATGANGSLTIQFRKGNLGCVGNFRISLTKAG